MSKYFKHLSILFLNSKHKRYVNPKQSQKTRQTCVQISVYNSETPTPN